MTIKHHCTSLGTFALLSAEPIYVLQFTMFFFVSIIIRKLKLMSSLLLTWTSSFQCAKHIFDGKRFIKHFCDPDNYAVILFTDSISEENHIAVCFELHR